MVTKSKKAIKIVDSWNTSLKPSEVFAKIRSFFLIHNIGYEKLSDQEILGTQGSQVSAHFFGGWLMSPSNLPKNIKIKLDPREHKVNIETKIEENIGLEKMNAEFKNDHEEYFGELLDSLKKELPLST